MTADEVIAEAKGANPEAVFTAKARAEINRYLTDADTAGDEILPLVRERVSRMDAFELKHAGSTIAAELPGMVAASRKAQQSQQEQAERMRQLEAFGAEAIKRVRQHFLAQVARLDAEKEFARLHAHEI